MIMAIGLIPTLILYFGYSILFSGGGKRGNNGSIFIIAIALVAMSFVFNLMILGVNRMRESYADMNSAETVPGASLTLQTALAKIEANQPHYFGKNMILQGNFLVPPVVKERHMWGIKIGACSI